MRSVASVRARDSNIVVGTRRRSALSALDLVRADLLVHVRPLDAEPDRGARDVPAAQPERIDDVLALRLLAELAQGEVLSGRRGRAGARRVGRAVVLERLARGGL